MFFVSVRPPPTPRAFSNPSNKVGTVTHWHMTTAPGLTWLNSDYLPSVLTLIGLDRPPLYEIGTNRGEIRLER